MRSARIEFHDSTISAIRVEDRSVRVQIDAYVHRWDKVDGIWQGTGWMQPVEVRILDSASAQQPALPADLSDGDVSAGGILYENMIPLPFDSTGPATLRLELVTGTRFELTGRDLTIEPTGESRFVEDLPDDFKPPDVA